MTPLQSVQTKAPETKRKQILRLKKTELRICHLSITGDSLTGEFINISCAGIDTVIRFVGGILWIW